HPTLSSSTARPKGTSTHLRAAQLLPGLHPTVQCPQHNPEHLTHASTQQRAPAHPPHHRASHTSLHQAQLLEHPMHNTSTQDSPHIPPPSTSPMVSHTFLHTPQPPRTPNIPRSTAPRLSPKPHTSLRGAQLLEHPLLPTHPMEHSFQNIPHAPHIPPWSTTPGASTPAPNTSLHGAQLLEHPLLQTHPSMEHSFQNILHAPHLLPWSTAPGASPCSQHIPPWSTSSRHPLLPAHPTEHPLLPTHPSMDHSPTGTLCNPAVRLAASFGAPPGPPQLPNLGRAVRVPVPGARPALTALSPGPAGA
ncbi:hypothetical protein Nmel_003341, partial [Mimus melanotis]